jgi:hypothetical protein
MRVTFFLVGIFSATMAAVQGLILEPSFDATEPMLLSVCCLLAAIFLRLWEK